MGCLSHPIDGDESRLSEIDFIQITFQDILFCILYLQHQCRQGLLELPSHRPLRRVKQILRQLLRDRAAALHHTTLREIGPERPPYGDWVDAEMGVEPS